MAAEFGLSYSYGAQGETAGRASVSDDALSVVPSLGEPLSLSLRDILDISVSDYKIAISVVGGITLALSGLGLKHEDFLRELCLRRNELILRDMLMEDALMMGGIRADYEFTTEEGQQSKGSCEVRVYETALVMLPDNGDLARLPFCELGPMSQEGFSLIIRSEYGQILKLSAMGRQLDPFRKGSPAR